MTCNGRAEAKRYHRTKMAFSLADMMLSLGYLTVCAFSDISPHVLEWVRNRTGHPYVQFLLFAGLLGAGITLLTLPLDFISTYVLEHSYRLSNQNIPAWLWERCKSTLLSLVIGIPAAVLFYYCLSTTGSWWWLYFSIFVYLFVILLARLAPVILFPLFYRFTPLQEEPLISRLQILMDSMNIRVNGVFSFNMSKDTRKANAGFTGIGRSRRIILSDTLLKNFSNDEIETIVAHEAGHYAGRHLIKNLIQSGIVIFGGLYLCGRAFEATLHLRGFSQLNDIAATPLLLFYLSLFSLLILPVLNAVSRRHERQADRHAVQTTGNRDAFVSALNKLASMNLADREPHPLVEFLFYSHPSISKRIRSVIETEKNSGQL